MFVNLASLAAAVLEKGMDGFRTEISGDGELIVVGADGNVFATGTPDVAMEFENLSEEVGFEAGKVAADIRLSGGDMSRLTDNSFDRLVRAIFEMNWLASQSMIAVRDGKSGPSTGFANGFEIVKATEVFLRNLTAETFRAAVKK